MVRPPEIPAATVSNEDDVQNIDIDLDDLVARFITPVELYRSLSVPNLHAATATVTHTNSQVDNVSALELLAPLPLLRIS